MKIRRITKGDKKDIFELAIEEDRLMRFFVSFPVYEKRLTKKSFEKLFKSYLKRDRFFYGIEFNKKVIGFIMGNIKKAPQGKVGYIDDLMISRKYKGKGLSTKLKDAFFEWLKKRKIRYCQLHLFWNNKNAFKIYKKWGFKIDGMQMTKKLK